jgi:Uma2 family endonuclease
MNVALKRMTAEEFIAWALDQPKGRYELFNGQVVAMNPQRIEQVRTKVRVARALQDSLEGRPCEAFGDGMSVQIDEATVYEPDALVYCGDRCPSGTLLIASPIVVVEVLSPGTKTIDTTRKLEGYFKLQSVRHYLIVDPEQCMVVHHDRDEAGAIATSMLDGGEVALTAIDVRIPVAAFFAD